MKNKKRVFLIEDDPILSKVIAMEIVEKCKVKIDCFATAEAALERLKDKPDVIIIDYFLPGMNGGEFLNLLKYEAASWEVIAISSQPQIKEVQQFFNMDIHSAVEKDTKFISTLAESVNTIVGDLVEEDLLFEDEIKDSVNDKWIAQTVIGLIVVIAAAVYLLEG